MQETCLTLWCERHGVLYLDETQGHFPHSDHFRKMHHIVSAEFAIQKEMHDAVRVVGTNQLDER